MQGNVNRKAVSKALLNLLTSAYTWNSTPRRVAVVPQAPPASDLPALFLVCPKERQEQSQAWGLPVYQRRYGCLIYFKTDSVRGDDSAADEADDILDGIDAAMQQGPFVKGVPTLPPNMPQTLGNLVTQCYISGDIQIIGAPARLGNYAVITIPITTITGS